MDESAILLLHSADRKGLVSTIANFLFAHGGNILHADQHQDAELGLFFMRIEWSLRDFDPMNASSARRSLLWPRPQGCTGGSPSEDERSLWRFSFLAISIASLTCSTGTRSANWTAISHSSSAITKMPNPSRHFMACRFITFPSLPKERITRRSYRSSCCDNMK